MIHIVKNALCAVTTSFRFRHALAKQIPNVKHAEVAPAGNTSLKNAAYPKIQNVLHVRRAVQMNTCFYLAMRRTTLFVSPAHCASLELTLQVHAIFCRIQSVSHALAVMKVST